MAQLTQNKQHPKGLWAVSYLTQAQQTQMHDNNYLQSNNVFQFRGVPGQANFSIGFSKVFNWLVQQPQRKYNRLDGTSSLKLWQQRAKLKENIELQWRVALVLQVLVLMILVLPLARVRPRQGRYAKFLPALLFYLLYAILLSVGRSLMSDKVVPTSIGLWWVHVAMLLIVFIYYAKSYQWLRWLRS